MKARLLAVALFLLGVFCLGQQAQSQLTLQNVGGGFGAPSGGIALISENVTQNAGLSSTQATTLAGTTAGNFIVVGVFWCEGDCNGVPGDSVSSVTSSNSGGGETCSHVAGTLSNLTHVGSDIWYCPNIVGGSDTLTATVTGSIAKFMIVAVSQWSGINNAAPVDGTLGNNNNTSTSTLSVVTNGNTTQSGELIYSIISGGAAVTSTPQTTINNLSGTNIIDEYQIATTLTTYTNSATAGSANVFTGGIAAFKHP